MINNKTPDGNTDSTKIVVELRDIARRKRRTADHIDEAIARHEERQVPADSPVLLWEDVVT